jgi:RimJ/RimL family protein N-acetyltransferase
MAADPGVQPVVRGARVLLRPWTANDVDHVYRACQDPDIQRWTTVPSPYQHSDAAAYVYEIAPQAWQDGGAVFAVVGPDNGEVLGTIGAHSMRDGVAHIGYWTVPAARRQGYTTDALKAITAWFLCERGAMRVELVTEPSNTGSRRVAERAGYIAEGILRSRVVVHGRRADVVMYSMLPSDLKPCDDRGNTVIA